MYAKKAQPLPNEQPLFEFDFDPRGYASTGTYTPWTEYGDAKKVAMVTSPEKGAYVDIETRDKALLSTVKHFGKVSMLGGLENAMHTPRRKELKSRYGSKLSDLMANAEVVRQEAQANARHEFRIAYGYPQMVKLTGDAVQASYDFADTYDKFQDKHYGPKGNSARTKLKRTIEKNQKLSETL